MSRNPFATNLRHHRQQIVPDKRDEQIERITLSEADFEAFAAALAKPPTPNAALKRLMQGDWEARECPIARSR